jgi:hypothetical protein
VRVNRAGSWQYVRLENVRPTDTVTVRRNDATLDVLVSELQAGDVRLHDRDVRRPPGEHRDETAQPDDVITAPRPRTNRRIREEGAGRIPI